MADIFLSYAREDRDFAARIAQALTAEGYDVFWDVEIPPGLSWADFLEEKLAASKAAIVLWSQHSTASQWVREEARLARDRGKLIPAMLDASAPPFGFGEIQAANLSSWTGAGDDANWRLLLSAIRHKTGAPAPQPRPEPPRPEQQRQRPAPSIAPAPVIAAEDDKKRTGNRNMMIAAGAGGVLVLAVIIAALMEGGGETGPGPIAPGPRAPVAQMAPAVAEAVNAARQAQTEAAAAAQEALTATATGNQATTNAQSGVMGFGAAPFNPTTTVTGDLASLMAGRPAGVTLRGPTDVFTGVLHAEPNTGRFIRTAGSSQSANGGSSVGVMTFNGDRGTFVGRSRTNAYSAEARTEGVIGAFDGSGVGVFQFADGTRYEGQFRAVGMEGRIVKQGYGAFYNASGALAQAGRFENDQYMSPQ